LKLEKKDINFLCNVTKLSKERLLLLIEERADYYLLLDTIAAREYTKEEFHCLSFNLIVPFVIFKLTKDKNFDFEEKSYIIDALCTFLPVIAHTNQIVIQNSKKSEKHSKLNFVLCGFLDIDVEDHQILKDIETGFRSAGKRELANHLKDWIEVIKTMKAELWKTVVV